MKSVKNPATWKSILFSLIGALLGAGIYVLLYYLEVISAIAIIFVFTFALIGYNLGGGNKKIKLPFILVMGIVLSFLGFYLGLYVTLAPLTAEILTGFNIQLSLFNVIQTIFKLGTEMVNAFNSDLLYFVIFLVVSVVLFVFSVIKEKKMEEQKANKADIFENNNIDATENKDDKIVAINDNKDDKNI